MLLDATLCGQLTPRKLALPLLSERDDANRSVTDVRFLAA